MPTLIHQPVEAVGVPCGREFNESCSADAASQVTAGRGHHEPRHAGESTKGPAPFDDFCSWPHRASTWLVFSDVWNGVVDELRAVDLLSDREHRNLRFVHLPIDDTIQVQANAMLGAQGFFSFVCACGLVASSPSV